MRKSKRQRQYRRHVHCTTVSGLASKCWATSSRRLWRFHNECIVAVSQRAFISRSRSTYVRGRILGALLRLSSEYDDLDPHVVRSGWHCPLRGPNVHPRASLTRSSGIKHPPVTKENKRMTCFQYPVSPFHRRRPLPCFSIAEGIWFEMDGIRAGLSVRLCHGCSLSSNG